MLHTSCFMLAAWYWCWCGLAPGVRVHAYEDQLHPPPPLPLSCRRGHRAGPGDAKVFLVPQRRERAGEEAHATDSDPPLLKWSATFLEAALHVRSMHVAAGLLRSGADTAAVEGLPAYRELVGTGVLGSPTGGARGPLEASQGSQGTPTSRKRIVLV
jgi:hypothetical protein